MAVNSISAASSQTQSVGQADFINLLLTQLMYQDPLKPMANDQFLTQMAQFSSLAQTQELNTNIKDLLSIQAATQSFGLLGKKVEVTQNGVKSTGTVEKIRFNGREPEFTVLSNGLDLTGITLSQITEINK